MKLIGNVQIGIHGSKEFVIKYLIEMVNIIFPNVIFVIQ
nr:MAG TPA: hypothetical protein [Caudoviricetes sp.]